MTSATERLRALLDERGVEWRKTPHYSSESQDNETVFEGNGIEWYANDHMNGRLGLRALRYEVTPEQAVEATLGRGTCKLDIIAYAKGGVDFAGFRCDGCGFTQAVPSGGLVGVTRNWNYCPNCGRKVEP